MLPSAFEVLGPVMVGPSSSHTAGALRLARVAREIAPGRVSSVEFTLYNSFAKTYLGHGTDKALVAGMLGLDTDDGRIRDSFSLAAEQGLAFSFRTSDEGTGLHPNTVDIAMGLADGGSLTVRGESVGGGRVRLSAVGGVAVDVAGEYPTLFVHHGDRPGVLARLTGALSAASINIATIRTFRDARGGDAYTVAELDEALPAELVAAVGAAPGVIFATSLTIPGALPVAAEGPQGPDFSCGADLLALCREGHASIGSVMREREACLAVGGARAADETMGRVRRAMEVSVRATVERPERSLGGFLHGQARAVERRSGALAAPLLGGALSAAVAGAMAVLERSAAMGVIVAAPTAGSAGVVPGALIACADALGAQERLEGALWCAAAVGAVVMANGSVSGAEGGCQAEVGTASAMAAAGLCQMLYGSPETCLTAASIALGNLLGLVCDPVGGLVEFPCQNRNAIGVANAFTSAQLALSSVGCPVPFDEAVQAMTLVGNALPVSLRETAQGGLAACPSACAACGSWD